jgi:hypothetical protein
MREYAILGCVVGVIACRGGGGDAKRDSLARDTMAVAGPAAVAVAPQPPSPGGSTTGGTKTTRTTPVTPGPPAVTDSVRGIVSVVGTERERRVVIARPGAPKRIQVTGPLASLIGHVAGADVWVTGTTSGTSLEATRFIVRTVDGASALDGTLKTEGPALYLVTTDGTRMRIAVPPPPLLGRDGARVWITGDPSRGVASFGFIDPPG